VAETDFYKLLGVKASATADEIRTAYRVLARKLHPDVNKAADAAKKFAEVQQAYEVLSDVEKRKTYDQFGAAAFSPGAGPPPGSRGGRAGAGGGGAGPTYSWSNVGGPGGQRPFDFDQADLGDIFGEIFGGGGGAGRGAYSGGGMGADPFDQSGRAAGGRRSAGGSRASVRSTVRVPFLTAAIGGMQLVRVEDAKGSRELEVRIPAGVEAGATLRVPGVNRGTRGAAGDVLLTVEIEPHGHFRRGEYTDTGEGLDVYVDVPLSIAEAALGATVKVPLLKGSVELNIPAGTPSGRKLRVRGQGIKEASGKYGDFYAVVQIVPPKVMKPEDAEKLREMIERENGELSGGVRADGFWQ
jgi:DnaJ-class molecular chaperone